MKHIPKYITSVTVKNQETENMKISLGLDGNGHIGVYFGDTAELEQDSNYINENTFPNTGLLAGGKYSMWLSMFSRHIRPTTFQDDDE